MPRKRRTTQQKEVQDYRHNTATRKNNPPAGIAAQGKIQETPKQEYAYNPHLPPNLRSDPNGDADKLPELLQIAQQRKLTTEEAKTLANALRQHDPWLEWAGKQETKSFTVDPIALHIHERVSAKAILKVAERQNVQRDLFADPQQTYGEAVDFYQHDVDWANRLILGDSLTVMSSLAHREDLAGKVQMIYIDPPYGIKFASNFQPTVFQRNVKDRAQDLTREQEQIRAYRDTWTLGIHSYLAYLRDRLIVAKKLLHDSGSVFVQISDENLHRVRCLLDEVFGSENFVSLITFTKTSPLGSKLLVSRCDYIIWFAVDKDQCKYHPLFVPKGIGEGSSYKYVELIDGTRRQMTQQEQQRPSLLPDGAAPFVLGNLLSTGYTESCYYNFQFEGRTVKQGRYSWKTTEAGMKSLLAANRVWGSGARPGYVQKHSDFPVKSLDHLWDDVGGAQDRKYVVETSTKVIQRCVLMTTDPGDIVLDPTCGSGTTPYVAEQWGRRWIAIDTSRVALALTRQRILTGSFDYYNFKDELKGITGGFINKRVPHVTLGNIAQNTALDPIFTKHEPILKEKLDILNRTLMEFSQRELTPTRKIRAKLLSKLAEKERRDGKRSITEADRRRWQLPETGWQEWEVPFDTDPDWPQALQDALIDYRKAWRAKMDEVNECIAKSSEGEELVDQPEVDRKRIRVSGPFTVEAVQPPEESLDTDSPIGGEPEEPLDTYDNETDGQDAINAEAYLDQMIRLLRNDGVRFPNNQTLKFATLDPLEGDVLHAEGSWEDDDTERLIAVVFGPQHGPVTAMQVEQCLRVAYRRGYDELVFAGFSFDGAAQAIIQEDPNPRVRIHIAHINPDVAMGGLLKETPTSQLFTVFGMPRTELKETANGEYIVKMAGVDIYNPVDNTVSSAGADKVAAWFVDADYDGRTFCITQAFFPDKSAWNKIARALKGVIDADNFEKFSGTESFSFPVGDHACVAVKVIDPRGNEVMSVHNLGEQRY